MNINAEDERKTANGPCSPLILSINRRYQHVSSSDVSLTSKLIFGIIFKDFVLGCDAVYMAS